MNEAQTTLDNLLQNAAAAKTTFPANSRYHAIATTVHTRADGRQVVHLDRRLVPAPERLATLYEHTVVQGDRLDQIAARHFGDPELYWRICDANGALRPAELTEEEGRRLRITLPEGIPGNSNA